MGREKSWAATAVVGFALVALSVLMAFFADHHCIWVTRRRCFCRVGFGGYKQQE